MDPTNRPSPPPPASPSLAQRPAPSARRRWLGTTIALLVLAAVAALAWHLTHRTPAAAAGGPRAAPGAGAPGGPGGPGGGGRGGPPTTVGLATAERTDLPVWVEALGTVVPAATVTVRPQVNGTLLRVLYNEGDTVRAGQVLAEIDPASFQMALMQARGARLRDEAQLQNARLTLQRFQTLLQQDSIARQDVDTQAALVRQLEAAIVTDKAAEGAAQLNVSYTRIKAPISGRVGLRPVDAGNLVSTSDTNGVATITQVTPIDVTFNLPQDRVPDVQARLAKGTPMQALALDRARVNTLDEGRFLTMDNQIDVQTGTVKAKARFGNTKGNLFPNQFVNLRLLLDTVSGAVTVPVTAVRQRTQGDYVYVLNNDRTVALRPVTRGLATADRVAITSGLQPGERVVTEGADRLRDGARVVLPGDRPASGPGGRGGRGQRGERGASANLAASGASAPWPASGASGAWAGRRHRASDAATGGSAPQ